MDWDEIKLCKVNKWFGFLYNNIFVLFYLIDIEDWIVNVLDYWFSVMGYDWEDVIGWVFSDFIYLDFWEEYLNNCG